MYERAAGGHVGSGIDAGQHAEDLADDRALRARDQGDAPGAGGDLARDGLQLVALPREPLAVLAGALHHAAEGQCSGIDAPGLSQAGEPLTPPRGARCFAVERRAELGEGRLDRLRVVAAKGAFVRLQRG